MTAGLVLVVDIVGFSFGQETCFPKVWSQVSRPAMPVAGRFCEATAVVALGSLSVGRGLPTWYIPHGPQITSNPRRAVFRASLKRRRLLPRHCHSPQITSPYRA
jgi:hypothetical protein